MQYDGDGSLNVEFKDADIEGSEYTKTPPVNAGNYYVRVTVLPDEEHPTPCVKEFQYEITAAFVNGYNLSGLFPGKEYNGDLQTWTTTLGATGDEGCDFAYDEIAQGERIQVTFKTNGAAVGAYNVQYLPSTIGSSGIVSVDGLDGTDLRNYKIRINDIARIVERTIKGELTFRKNYNGLATVDITDLTGLSNFLQEDENATLKVTLSDAEVSSTEKEILSCLIFVGGEDKTKYYNLSKEQLHIFIDEMTIT